MEITALNGSDFDGTQQLDSTSKMSGKLQFIFVTNRPIGVAIVNAIEDARSKAPPRDKVASTGLSKYTNLGRDKLAQFCDLLRIEGEHGGFLAQRSALESDFRLYLPGNDQEALLA